MSNVIDMPGIPEGLRGGGWKSKLSLTPTMSPKPIIRNALIALREAPEWSGVLAYDEFALTTMAMRAPPWLIASSNSWVPCNWSDQYDTLTTEWLQGQGIAVPVNVGANAVEAIAVENSFHPIRDYLTGLEWDKVERLGTFATKYLGTVDNSYSTAVGRCFFIAAVARIMRPGCKSDHIPILEGEQGTFKSSMLDVLFSPWFSDDLADLGSKDAAMQTRVAWGIEIAELSSMRRGAEVERIKAFITRKVDRFRPSYGRRVIEVPRQCVFIGTTNADGYLKDETGARRFWPLRCSSIDLAGIRTDRDQLWAEAVVLYRNGEVWWLTDPGDLETALLEQSDSYAVDAWEPVVREYVDGKSSTSVGEVLENAIFIEKAKWSGLDQSRVGKCLVAIGWKAYRGPRPAREPRYKPKRT